MLVIPFVTTKMITVASGGSSEVSEVSTETPFGLYSQVQIVKIL